MHCSSYAKKEEKRRNIKREYSDGIKSKETRPGWKEAHNVCEACVYRYHREVLS